VVVVGIRGHALEVEVVHQEDRDLLQDPHKDGTIVQHREVQGEVFLEVHVALVPDQEVDPVRLMLKQFIRLVVYWTFYFVLPMVVWEKEKISSISKSYA